MSIIDHCKILSTGVENNERKFGSASKPTNNDKNANCRESIYYNVFYLAIIINMKPRSAFHENLKIIGKTILLSSIGFSVASVEMSSKFSVRNFSKDQSTLQRASDALDAYNLVGGLWALGVCLLMYGQYGMKGLISSIFANLAVLLWINLSYLHSFRQAANEEKLKFPKVLWGFI